MLLDLIDLSKLRRAIVYGLLLAAVLVIQNQIVSRLPLFGVRPVLLPALVVAVALFEGGVWGGILGLAAGYFADFGCANYVVLFTVLLSAAGFFTGVLGKYMLHKGFVSYVAMLLLALVLVTFCQMFRFLFLADEDQQAFHALYIAGAASWPVLRTGLVQVAWSLIFSLPLYFPCKAIAARPMGK